MSLEGWTYERARQLLLPDVPDAARGATVPANWARWTEPNPKLAIDEAVTRLLFAGRGGGRRVKPTDAEKKELFSRGVLCPYYVAREYIVLAIDRVEVQAFRARELDARDARREDEIRRGREIQSAAESLRRLLEVSPTPPAPPDLRAGLDAVDPALASEAHERATREHQDLLRAISIARRFPDHLRLIGDALADRPLAPKPDVKNVWLMTFLRVVGALWTLLKGDPPPKSENAAWIDFAEAALVQVGVDFRGEGGARIRNAIEFARNSPNAWDRPESIAKGELPPSVASHLEGLVRDRFGRAKRFVEKPDGATAILTVPAEAPLTSVEITRRLRAFWAEAAYRKGMADNVELTDAERNFAKRLLLTLWFNGGNAQREVLERIRYAPPPPPSDAEIKRRRVENEVIAASAQLMRFCDKAEIAAFVESGGRKLPHSWKSAMRARASEAGAEDPAISERGLGVLRIAYALGNASMKRFLEGMAERSNLPITTPISPPKIR